MPSPQQLRSKVEDLLRQAIEEAADEARIKLISKAYYWQGVAAKAAREERRTGAHSDQPRS